MKLTTANMNDILEGISFSELRTVSPDEESKKSGIKKTVNLKVNFDGMSLGGLIALAFNPVCVSWQNGGGGRKNYDNLVDRQTVNVQATAPGKAPQIDPRDAMIANLKAMTKEEQKAYLAKLVAEAEANI